MEKARGRRERKEQGSLEDRSGTSGEEENRGREGGKGRIDGLEEGGGGGV